MGVVNKLVLIGNGFDLAHNLKTRYSDFLFWYLNTCFEHSINGKEYRDQLLSIQPKFYGKYPFNIPQLDTAPKILRFLEKSDHHVFNIHSEFLRNILLINAGKNWVDIEHEYFKTLKLILTSKGQQAEEYASRLNQDFTYITTELSKYLLNINETLHTVPGLDLNFAGGTLTKIFNLQRGYSDTLFLNFNYTDTLIEKAYASENETIFIHGRVSDGEKNPIIFGYGDETDPAYQLIEDFGNNDFLMHIKSFSYFRTPNYQKLLSFVDSQPFTVTIIGHSCGLSDRVLLNEIFEHENCQKIDIFFYSTAPRIDNYKEITQNISRHFRPQNKAKMRRKIIPRIATNQIPQN
jgi:hypothetical protein